MCYWVNVKSPIAGSGKGPQGWFSVSEANVGFDHPSHAQFEHCVLIDFSNPAMGSAARVAVEMDVPSARALMQTIQSAIEAAESAGAPEAARPAVA